VSSRTVNNGATDGGLILQAGAGIGMLIRWTLVRFSVPAIRWWPCFFMILLIGFLSIMFSIDKGHDGVIYMALLLVIALVFGMSVLTAGTLLILDHHLKRK